MEILQCCKLKSWVLNYPALFIRYGGGHFERNFGRCKIKWFCSWSEIVIDHDTLANAIVCSEFPDIHITYCGNHTARGVAKNLKVGGLNQEIDLWSRGVGAQPPEAVGCLHIDYLKVANYSIIQEKYTVLTCYWLDHHEMLSYWQSNSLI